MKRELFKGSAVLYTLPSCHDSIYSQPRNTIENKFHDRSVIVDKILIIGHRQPDTDCIASVIGYAAFKNQMEPDKYLAARCGELNAETCFALETFGIKAPVLIDSIEPRVSDLAIHRISVTQNVPTVDVAALMDTHDIRNVPITDEEGKLVGIVGEHGLAQA